jgi:hypothetical protein
MKTTIIALLAGSCLAVSAQADFIGLGYRDADVVAEYNAQGYVVGPIVTDLSTVTVYELFAVFTAPDRVLGVGPVSMQTDTAFVNYDGIGAASDGLPSNSGDFIPMFGEIAVDSFLTIGELANPSGSSSAVGGNPIPDFADGASIYQNSGAGYGVSASSGIGEATYNPIIELWTVRIAQVIVENTSSGDPGDLAVSFQLTLSSTTTTAFGGGLGGPPGSYYVPLIPAPGALALLGLCGVTARRRRRA